MADFIDRDKTEQDIINRDSRISAAVADIDSYLTGKAQMQMEILDIIREQPTVDTEQHAHWEQPSCFDEENNVFQCSNCKEEFVLISGSPKENGYEYCPHCGCKMDEVATSER